MKTLIKFNGDQTPAFLKSIKGKKVCDVTRRQRIKDLSLLNTKMPYVQWNGSTETEYFIAIFYSGMLSLDINEREMLLGTQEHVPVIAISNQLELLNEASKTKDEFNRKIQLNIKYVMGEYLKDLVNISFTEVMKIAGWKFASRKVKENDFDFENFE